MTQESSEIVHCTGCGFCCLSELCPAAKIVLGDFNSICPFLLWTDERYYCSLIKTETSHRMEPILAETLGIGTGCRNHEFVPHI
jgi:hypothetical protein